MIFVRIKCTFVCNKLINADYLEATRIIFVFNKYFSNKKISGLRQATSYKPIRGLYLLISWIYEMPMI